MTGLLCIIKKAVRYNRIKIYLLPTNSGRQFIQIIDTVRTSLINRHAFRRIIARDFLQSLEETAIGGVLRTRRQKETKSPNTNQDSGPLRRVCQLN